MKLSTGFDLNIEDINTYFNKEVFQDGQETIQIVHESTEIEDQNVPVSAAQNVLMQIRMFRKMLLILKLLNPKR